MEGVNGLLERTALGPCGLASYLKAIGKHPGFGLGFVSVWGFAHSPTFHDDK